jgi:type VI secretion system protein ImpI
MAVALVARVFDTQANQRFEVTFERFPVRIGRNQLNDLHLDRPYVSQFHAALDIRERQVFVRDLGSTNGTVYKGQRLVRDAPVEITAAPEMSIGPIVIQLSLVDVQAPQPGAEGAAPSSVLDFDPARGRMGPKLVVGAEDPFVRQLAPYIEAYRTAWSTVYRVVYDHLGRIPAEARTNYLRRLAVEFPGVAGETDFQKLSQYYGVEPRTFADLSPAHAAFASLSELAKTLAPTGKPLDDVASVISFSRRLRDAMEVFLKSFVSLRDGYREFAAEILGQDPGQREASGAVASAKDAKSLGDVLLAHSAGPEASRQLHDIFVDVMQHQVALLNGVMEGVRSLLDKLSPRKLEEELEKKGKKGGFFSSKFEELWKLYEVRHGDYSGEDKETFLIIFGPQFSRAYAAAAGEEGTEAGKNLQRYSTALNVPQPPRR